MLAVSAAALVLPVVAIALATDLGLGMAGRRVAAESSRAILPGRSGVLLVGRSVKITSGGGEMGWWGLVKAEMADWSKRTSALDGDVDGE